MKKYFFIIIFLVFVSSTFAVSGVVEADKILKTDNKVEQEYAYIIEHKFNGKVFKAQLPQSIINIYKNHPDDFIVPAEYLFLEPVVLLLLHELTKRVTDTFNQVNLSYWALGYTGAAINAFASFAPWDSDCFLAVDVNQWQEKNQEITNLLKKSGIVFFLDKNQANTKFILKVEFDFATFSELVQRYEPLMDKKSIANLYKKISNTFIKPKIEIIPFIVSRVGVKHYIPYLHKYYLEDGGNETGYNFSDIFPLVQKQLNNFNVATMKQSKLILQDDYDFCKDFDIFAGICTNCQSLKIGDISQHKEFLIIIRDYLDFVFKDSFANHSYLDNLINQK